MRTEILYEDQDILVVYKPAGIATQASGFMQVDVFSELKNYLAMTSKERKEPYLGIIHRLDQPVEGVLVFAKNPASAANLSKQIAQRMLKKEYLAAVFLSEEASYKEEKGKSITLTDYLVKDGKTNTSTVTNASDENAKKAVLSYEILSVKTLDSIDERQRNARIALLSIQLETGRHHQIRVQCAHAGMPLLGDQKYGSKESQEYSQNQNVKDVALCAHKLTFKHPKTGKKMEFSTESQKPAIQAFM